MLLLIQGNALMIGLADESVHCCVCSPPYWNLRDYGIPGQLGMEPMLEEYVANMVAVFREVRRVLRSDGTVWLNLGDSYATSQAGNTHWNNDIGNNRYYESGEIKLAKRHIPDSLKPKDLIGIPWRVAFALQADGWWLRSDIIWSKPNPMPESVTDRPTKAHEYLFLLTKSAKYYYDQDAVREGYTKPLDRWGGDRTKPTDKTKGDQFSVLERPGRERRPDPAGRNRRSVWHIATAPYSGAHFATYPPALVEPCIKAGTSERVCPECGAPWERVVESTKGSWHDHSDDLIDGQSKARLNKDYERNTLGWRPTCEHYPHTERWREFPPQGEMTDDEYYWSTLNIRLERRILVEFWCKFTSISATVFDPFVGSGTTLQVARALGRNGIGLDLSLEYLHLARTRLSLDALDAWGKARKDGTAVTDLPIFMELIEHVTD